MQKEHLLQLHMQRNLAWLQKHRDRKNQHHVTKLQESWILHLGLDKVVQGGKHSLKKKKFICWEKRIVGKNGNLLTSYAKGQKTGKERARWEGLKHHIPNI